MDYIHSTLHKLHRDLKSGNVLCTGSAVAPRVKIGDFGSIKEQLQGISNPAGMLKEAGGSSIKMTRGVGTPVYMAIEMMRAEEYDGSAEVWSFGVMLYEIATHHLPDLLTELPAEVVGKRRGGPYLGQVLKLLEAGHRLELNNDLVSEGEPSWYRPLMARCMLEEARQRPDFATIVDEIAI